MDAFRLLCLIFLVHCLLLWDVRSPEVQEVVLRHCRHCDYDLAGLNEEALCPECGCDAPHVGFVSTPGGLEVPPERLARAVLATLVWVIAMVSWPGIAQAVVSIHYLRLGLPWDVARWAALQNELNTSRPIVVKLMNLFWPMLLPLVLLLLTVRLSWRRWLTVNGALMLAGLLGLLVRWS